MLIEQRTGGAFFSVSRFVPPPYTPKTRHFLPPFKNQGEILHRLAFSLVWTGVHPKVKADIDNFPPAAADISMRTRLTPAP